MQRPLRYRLGLDIGSTSIGWCMLRLDHADPPKPVALIKMGVRIFSDGRNPKDGSSLAVTRRLARQMRRRRDRLLKRKNRLTTALIRHGFFPEEASARKALVALDPYQLRKKGLDEPLTPSEFGRALFHLNQRRGFKSNRRTDKSAADAGALKSAIKGVRERLEKDGARTIGEWLAYRHERRESVRARLRGSGTKATYDLYVDRAMIEAEFDALWVRQAALQPHLFREEARAELKDILLFQRPLRPVVPGRCTLIPTEARAPLALPSVQRFRVYQEANNLRTVDARLAETPLTLAQRDAVVELLERTATVTFAGLRKALKLAPGTRFNLEDKKREKLKGNTTSVTLARPEHFGDAWWGFVPERQDAIVERLIAEQSESALVEWLVANTGIDEAAAELIATAGLPEGFGSLSRQAIGRILPKLQQEVQTYDKAVLAAGFDHHSSLTHSQQTGEVMSELPYYGKALQRHVSFGTGVTSDSDEQRYGRIANPTVHIGLNELRKVVNRLLDRYGPPAEIVVELARELKLSKERRDEIHADQAKRQEENERYAAEIKALLGIAPSAKDIQAYRLWTELAADPLQRCCPYTGEPISIALLFSDAVEVDHILPFSMTLDDSMNNKVIAMRRANRDKGNRTPYDAFGHSPAGYDYAAILGRAKLMPTAKAKRFVKDAYALWLRDDKDFLARALNDTSYLSRIAREYLSLVCPFNKVRAIPGRLTGLLRGKYGLNLNRLLSEAGEKNRTDHRHHAVDAFVVALTDQGLLQRFASASEAARLAMSPRLVDSMPALWPNYRKHVGDAVSHIIVSHKPDHGHQGRLHNDTSYGLLPGGRVVHRVPLDRFKSASEIERAEFASSEFKLWLVEQTKGLAGRDLQATLARIADANRVRRARLVEKLDVIPVTSSRAGDRHGRDGAGQPVPYKGYKGDSNYCMEIVRRDDGTWESEVISTFDANRIAKIEGPERLRDMTRALDGRPLAMRLVIDDVVRLQVDGELRCMRVCVIKTNGTVLLADHFEANVDARNRDPQNEFTYVTRVASSLQKAKARRVTVSPIGELRDSGQMA